MFPIRHELDKKKFPLCTILLILLCILVFICQWRLPNTPGLIPLDFMYTAFHPSKGFGSTLIILVLSFFMHANLIHLISNIWYLWIFGSAAESTIGTFRFTSVYFICGITSMLFQVLSSPLSQIPIVGASGAIAGVMGLSLILLPLAPILVWIPPVFVIKIPAFIFLLLWFGIQYVNLFYTDPNHGNIAWWAHIGGYATGVVFAIILKLFFRQPNPVSKKNKKSKK